MAIFDLLISASFLGKFILLVLFISSIVSWGVLFIKWKSFKAIENAQNEFLNHFWSSKNIDEIFAKVESLPAIGVHNLFISGIRELKRFAHHEHASHHEKIENLERSMERAISSELLNLEKYLNVLASVASVAPFIGLFGTVLGIMGAFQGIAQTGNAQLATVAPGIAESLVTTAAGIGVAIPALLGFNFFQNQLRKIHAEMNQFCQDLLNMMARSFIASAKSTKHL